MIVMCLAWATVGAVMAKGKSFREDGLVNPQPRQAVHGARVRVTAQHAVVQVKLKRAVRAGSSTPKNLKSVPALFSAYVLILQAAR
jgi:hypothetical protein